MTTALGTARRARLRLLTVLSLVLVLLGGGTAAAYWTATATLDAAAGAAAVGLEQTTDDSAGSLETVFSAETLTASQAVTLTNTGSREASFSLTVRTEAGSDQAFADALALGVQPVASALDCTPAGATGTASVTHEGTLAPGKSVVLCVSTTLDAQDLEALSEQQLILSITSSLRYAEGEAWTVHAPELRATQTVARTETKPAFGGAEMTCPEGGDAPWFLAMSFPANEGKQGETTYRVFLAQEATPDKRVAYDEVPGGWDTVVRFQHGSDAVTSYVESQHGGMGPAWLIVEQKVNGEGSWAPAAYGKVNFVTTPYGDSVGVECGW